MISRRPFSQRGKREERQGWWEREKEGGERQFSNLTGRDTLRLRKGSSWRETSSAPRRFAYFLRGSVKLQSQVTIHIYLITTRRISFALVETRIASRLDEDDTFWLSIHNSISKESCKKKNSLPPENPDYSQDAMQKYVGMKPFFFFFLFHQ